VVDTRDVSLSTSKSVSIYGSGFILTGKVTSNEPGPGPCVSGVDVLIRRDPFDDVRAWIAVARVKTDRAGLFRLAVMAENSATYRAEVPQVDHCGAAHSRRRTVQSKLRLTLLPTVVERERGDTFEFTARVFPRCGESVDLQKLINGRFSRVATAAPDDRCVAIFRRQAIRDGVFRIRHREVTSVAFFYLGGRSGLSVVSVPD
jgi:hypothetical protein